MKEYEMGQWIRRGRKDCGMTQEELAEGLCSASHLSRVENGSQLPSRVLYQQLMQRLEEAGFFCSQNTAEEEAKKAACLELLRVLSSNQVEDAWLCLLSLQREADESDRRFQQFLAMAEHICKLLSHAVERTNYYKVCEELWEERSGFFKKKKSDIKSYVTATGTYSALDVWILNNLAIGRLWQGEYRQCMEIFSVLFASVQQNPSQYDSHDKLLAILCNNMAVCALSADIPRQAFTFCKRGISYIEREGGGILLLHLIRLQMEAAQLLGDQNCYFEKQILLRQLFRYFGKKNLSCEEMEQLLWERKEIFVVF